MTTAWDITEYTYYARHFARTHTRAELVKLLEAAEAAQKAYTAQHLGAIKKTSVRPNGRAGIVRAPAARRANARNKVGANYEKLNALRNAIEIHDVWPEYSKPDEPANSKS